MDSFLQMLIAGLLLGAAYGLLATGLGLIFGVMRIINFAQADFAMLAMYIPTYFFMRWWGLDPLISVVIAIPIFLVLGFGVQRLVVERVIGRPGSEEASLIMTMGFALILQNIALVLWTGASRNINMPYTVGAWTMGPLIVNHARTYAFLISIAVAGALILFMSRTRLGRAIRAAAEEPEACAYMGINLRLMYGIAFALGIAVTAIAGVLIATYRPFDPYVGHSFIVLMFAAVVLGGMGSIPGALLGGLIIGLVQQLSTLVLPIAMQNVAIYGIFVLMLYLRPQGILGKRGRIV